MDTIANQRSMFGRPDATLDGRFDTLDGMRGVAAVVVLIFHFRLFFPQVFIPPNGYLAVDLFFGLSGFVLAHAYGAKMTGGMTVGQFMRMRFARLYPMYILGTAISVVLLSLSLPRSASDLLPLPFAAIMAPSPITEQLYPLNVPAWSLFLELLVNIALVAFWKRLSIPVVLAICFVSSICLIASAIYYGGLDFGHRWEALAVGFARVFYSFFVGVGLRLTGVRLSRIPPLVTVLILLATFLMPVPEGWRVMFDLVVVLIVFPGLLMAGAYANVGRLASRVCRWSGEISYPLYATHNPILVGCYALTRTLHIPVTSITIAGVVAITIAFAWLAEVLFDKPVRVVLRERLVPKLTRT